ncbi:hypothetical protein [Nannocystis pusilla]|uniref:hypothetical protein n=1 Tax=Nannocystis pusilla TaxID=889268 RepID=UPI003BEF7789
MEVHDCRRWFRLFALSLVGLGCGSDSDPLDSIGATANMSGPGSNGPSGPGEPPGGTTAGAESETDGVEPTTGDATTTGEAEPGREICEVYLDCLAVTVPEMLPSAQMGFGQSGTCWEGTPEAMQQCIDACVAGIDQLHMSFPDEPKCFECAETADCPAGERCVAGGCAPPKCGDGIVDEGELCDYPEGGCFDCDELLCNPLTNQGCEATEFCQLYFDGTTECNEGPPLPEGASCSFDYPACDAGLICMPGGYLLGCDDEACCTPLCDLQNGAVCPAGLNCNNTYFLDKPVGNYGMCIVPV